MKVVVKRHLGYSPALEEHHYVLVAENGIVERETAQAYIPAGTELELPDETWSLDSETFTVRCDDCGHIYEVRTLRGYEVRCPVCDHAEVI
jgi:ribosomal protein S27E